MKLLPTLKIMWYKIIAKKVYKIIHNQPVIRYCVTSPSTESTFIEGWFFLRHWTLYSDTWPRATLLLSWGHCTRSDVGLSAVTVTEGAPVGTVKINKNDCNTFTEKQTSSKGYFEIKSYLTKTCNYQKGIQWSRRSPLLTFPNYFSSVLCQLYSLLSIQLHLSIFFLVVLKKVIFLPL